ncbi:MAG: hypothetical protein ACYTEZ_16455 [Planctomycetota bacterium]|jgi:predicted  nucleic acid-binding Zn-ribbon protein
MSRLLILALVCLAACDREKEPQDLAGGLRDPAPPPTARKPDPVSPPTGYPALKQSHDSLREEIERAEEALQQGRPPEARLVKQQVRLIDNLIVATERAIREEARQGVQHTHALLQQQHGKLHQKRSEVWAEIAEMEQILAEARKGAGAGVPPGFTEAEIRDRLGDFREMARKIEQDLDELRARLQKQEDLLKLETIPPQGETLLTKELEALRESRQRLEALLK